MEIAIGRKRYKEHINGSKCIYFHFVPKQISRNYCSSVQILADMCKHKYSCINVNVIFLLTQDQGCCYIKSCLPITWLILSAYYKFLLLANVLQCLTKWSTDFTHLKMCTLNQNNSNSEIKHFGFAIFNKLINFKFQYVQMKCSRVASNL